MTTSTPIDKVYSVHMGSIYYDKEFNCRADVTPESVQELAQSIEVNGLQTPIHIQELEGLPPGFRYRIVAGHRRYQAHLALYKSHIKAIILQNLNEQQARILNLSENIDRKDLTPYEEAMALVNIFPEYTSLHRMSKILGRSREWCRRRRLIAELPEEIRYGFHTGSLGVRDLLALSALDPAKRPKAAKRLMDARDNGRKIPMGSVSQVYPHRGTEEIKELLQYFAHKHIDGLPKAILLWVLGQGETSDIRKMTRAAELDHSKALYK